MLKRIKRLNIVGYVLLGFQVLVYFTHLIREPMPVKDTEKLAGYYFGYYLGFNLWLIIAGILFIQARNLRKKLKALELRDMVNSIGSGEQTVD